MIACGPDETAGAVGAIVAAIAGALSVNRFVYACPAARDYRDDPLLELARVAGDHRDALVGVQPGVLGVGLEVAVEAGRHGVGLRVTLLEVEEVAHALRCALHLAFDHAGGGVGGLPARAVVGERFVAQRQFLVAQLDVLRVLLQPCRAFEHQAAHCLGVAHRVAQHGGAAERVPVVDSLLHPQLADDQRLVREGIASLLGDRSIGRTADSGSANQGSSPCPSAILFMTCL